MLKSNFSLLFFNEFIIDLFMSMHVMFLHPLEANSKLMLPVPANKSKTLIFEN